MTCKRNCTLTNLDPAAKFSYLCLLMAGGMEFLFATTYFFCIDGFFYINEYIEENYLILPSMLFLGAILTHPLSRQSKRRLLLGFATVVWFLITEFWHGANDHGLIPFGPVFLLYLMAFPFATVTRDGEKHTGLTLMGLFYIAAGMVLVFYTGLLYIGRVPPIMRSTVYWDGARLTNVWHPNVCAALFLIGYGLSTAFFLRTKCKWLKACFLFTASALFLCLTLTNSRTSILMGCAMMGGIAFFALIQKGGWKRFVAGVAAALVIALGLYLFSQSVYQLHTNYRISKFVAQIEAEKAAAETTPPETASQETIAETTPPETVPQETVPSTLQDETVVPEIVPDEKMEPILSAASEEAVSVEHLVGTLRVDNATGEVTLVSNSGQGSLMNDIWTFNGRTIIWKAAFRALASDPVMLFFGTKNVTGVVASHGSFAAAHAHNSWVQVLMNLGLFGLLFALVYTFLILRSALFLLFGKGAELWQKVVAILVLCMLMAGMLEFYLFIPDYAHFLAFPFHFFSGCLVHWQDQLSAKR